jgi:hypothetical protein
MFESAIAINEFQLGGFEKIVADVPDDCLFIPAAGHGHPPVWILGHLALTGEMGQQMVGGEVTHTDWLPLFGPGSTDKVAASESLAKPVMAAAVIDAYRTLRELAAKADPDAMSRRHHVPIFRATSIRTIADCVTLLLTSHFGFHLSQLSSCRRAAGHAPLF